MHSPFFGSLVPPDLTLMQRTYVTDGVRKFEVREEKGNMYAEKKFSDIRAGFIRKQAAKYQKSIHKTPLFLEDCTAD